MANFSFDIVSEVNLSEINNVFDQVKREIESRYDFKNTPADLEWIDDKKGFKILGNSDYQIESIIEIIRKKLAARNLDQKVIDVSKDNLSSNLITSKVVPFKAGLDQEKAKQISKVIRETAPKAKSQIMGETVRVTSSSKDELQNIISILRKQDLDFPIQFTNYR